MVSQLAYLVACEVEGKQLDVFVASDPEDAK